MLCSFNDERVGGKGLVMLRNVNQEWKWRREWEGESVGLKERERGQV